MDRHGTSRAARVAHARALRWRAIRRRGVTVAALLLAACARWPLPDATTADAAPQLIQKSWPQTSAALSSSIAVQDDHIDGLRTFGGSPRIRSGGGKTEAFTAAPAGSQPELALGSTREYFDRNSAGAGSGATVQSPSPGAQQAAPDAVVGFAIPTHSLSATGAASAAGSTNSGGVATVGDAEDPASDAGRNVGASAEAGEANVGAASRAGRATVAAPSGSASPATSDVRNAAPHPVALTVVPGSLHASNRTDEIDERAKWWLGGIVATLLLLLFAGRRGRPQRVMKMNTHRDEPVGSPQPSTSPDLRADQKPRVRMFSAYEVYVPKHESHTGPWEAPVRTERGFAHRYQLGEESTEGLLFVAEPESGQPGAPESAVHTRDPASFAATVTTPAGLAIATAAPAALSVSPEKSKAGTLPLVFQAACTSPSEARAFVQPLVVHASELALASTIQNPTLSLPVEAAVAALGAIAAVEPVAKGALAQETPWVARVEDERSMADPAGVSGASQPPRPIDAAKLEPDELGLYANVPTELVEPVSERPVAVQTPVQPSAHASDPPTSRRDCIAEARQFIASGAYPAALVQLDEAMQSAHPSSDVWVMSALCWWQIARADGGSKAYANAADAMERLLERDPSQIDIWYRSGSCRLLQAAGERGATQRATLDLAIAALRRAAPEGGQGDPLRNATLGDALLERAQAATDETAASRAKRIAEAVHVLRDAARVARDPASMASWKLQQALQTQANLLSSTDASKVRLEADAVLAAGVESATEEERLSWYAARVENELAHAELADGATRTLHLRTFRENYRDILTGPNAAPQLLLSWLELLALETGHLRGDAARSRFDEGEAILKRLDAMLPGNSHVALARARLLRRRAAQSHAVARPAALSDAIAGLMPLVEHGDAPQLQIETAELMLDRAACVPSTQTCEENARAEAMATGLLQHPVFAMAAARCVLQARLGQSSAAVDPAVCSRLEALAGNDVRSRWLLARAALLNGSPREACGHCEAAARSGVRLDQAMVQLWDQASRKWSATLHGQKDAAWLANKQSLRSAG